MSRILNLESKNFIGQEVLIKGWVSNRRNMGKIAFLDMRDRSGILQVVVVPAELDEDSQNLISEIRSEYVLEIRGIVNERGEKQKNTDLPTGLVELLAKKIKILSRAETLPYDLSTEMRTDTYLDNLPLNLREEKKQAIFKIQSELIAGFRDHLDSNGFTEFQSPKIVAGATEGGANVFTVNYFGRKAYLGQSPQFYKQIMVGVFERVYTTGNVYRAEEHDTNRHINEYTSLDFEMGFIDDYTEVMQMVYQTVFEMMSRVRQNCSTEIKMLQATMPEMPEKYPVLKLKEAQKILENKYGEKGVLDEPDLEPHQERLLGQYAKENFNSDFIFITHYPVAKRPMYTMEDPNDPGFTKSFDLLFRGTEIVTGSQRINEYDNLVKNMEKFGLNPADFQYYLQAFKYGMPPEGGIGMGLERVTWQLLGLDNIKKATLFPRDQVRIDELLSEK